MLPQRYGGGVVLVEQGFCQSQIDTRAKIEDWNEDKFVW